MLVTSFSELIEQFQPQEKIRVGVVNPVDMNSLEAVLHPNLAGLVQPVLVGDTIEILNLLSQSAYDSANLTIIDESNEINAATKAVSLVNEGEIDVLMKGHIQTSDFLRPIVNREQGIVETELLTHVVVNELPGYHKLLISSDGGMVPEPTLADKKAIVKHAVKVSQKLGNSKPKVALLAAAETINHSIKSSVEGKKLMTYFQTEYPEDCFVDGPISLDLAISPRIVELKHYQSNVAGDADILIGPDMTAMNILGKSMITFGQGKMAGIIYGAKVPIVMTSRASSSEEKFQSLVLAAMVAG